MDGAQTKFGRQVELLLYGPPPGWVGRQPEAVVREVEEHCGAWMALDILKRFGGRAHAKQLADELGISVKQISNRLQHLRRKKYIQYTDDKVKVGVETYRVIEIMRVETPVCN